MGFLFGVNTQSTLIEKKNIMNFHTNAERKHLVISIKLSAKMANSLYLQNLLVTFDLRSYPTLSRITNRVISNALLAKRISVRFSIPTKSNYLKIARR